MRNLVFILSILMLSSCKVREKTMSTTADITCPHCGFTATEPLPTETCLIVYDCKGCGEKVYPKEEDCCVFCSYGTHKCPSKQ